MSKPATDDVRETVGHALQHRPFMHRTLPAEKLVNFRNLSDSAADGKLASRGSSKHNQKRRLPRKKKEQSSRNVPVRPGHRKIRLRAQEREGFSMSVILSHWANNGPAFPVTDWKLVRAAAGEGASATAARASLFENYWHPLYAFLRRTGHAKSADEALELTHEFFIQRFYEKPDLARADPEKGCFHHWMTHAICRFVYNQRKASTAQWKDWRRLVWTDAHALEERIKLEASTPVDPQILLEYEVALAALNAAMSRLEAEYAACGEGDWYRAAQPYIGREERGIRYAPLAQRFGLRDGSVRARIHRMRRRLRDLALEESARGCPKDASRMWFINAVWARHFNPAAVPVPPVRRVTPNGGEECSTPPKHHP